MSKGAQLIKEAMDTARILLARHNITSQADAHRLARERMSDSEFEQYKASIAIIFNNGGLG
jgi:hypothetical protein